MATGVTWSTDHTDLTNHYIRLGVMGGLPTMLSFIWIMVVAFRSIGIAIRTYPDNSPLQKTTWILGAILFSHSFTFLTVSYFDQSIYLFYILLVIIVTIGYVINPSFRIITDIAKR